MTLERVATDLHAHKEEDDRRHEAMPTASGPSKGRSREEGLRLAHRRRHAEADVPHPALPEAAAYAGGRRLRDAAQGRRRVGAANALGPRERAAARRGDSRRPSVRRRTVTHSTALAHYVPDGEGGAEHEAEQHAREVRGLVEYWHVISLTTGANRDRTATKMPLAV